MAAAVELLKAREGMGGRKAKKAKTAKAKTAKAKTKKASKSKKDSVAV
jgi:hypothetical protein